MPGRLPLIIAAAAAAFLLPPGSAAAQDVRLVWDAAGTTEYRVFAGTSSRTYTTNWTALTNSFELPLAALPAGTNYVAVASVAVTAGTNALLSDYSEEVTIVRLPAPVLRINVELPASTNLTAWLDSGNVARAIVSADGNIQFFRPGHTYIELAGAIETETAEPEAAQPPPLPGQ